MFAINCFKYLKYFGSSALDSGICLYQHIIKLGVLTAVFFVVSSNKECKGLITTAEGKFFSNGFDLQWLAGFVQQPDTISNFMTDFHKLTARILTFPLPTLAALNGKYLTVETELGVS